MAVVRNENIFNLDSTQNREVNLRLLEAISKRLRSSSQVHRIESVRVYGGGGFLARRAERAFRLYSKIVTVLFLLVPAVSTGLYFGFYASPQYVTTSRFSVSSESGGIGAAITSILGNASSEGTGFVREYIQSSSILVEIQKKMDFDGVFGRSDIDIISRLKVPSSLEDRLNYWKSMVSVKSERFTGQAVLNVRAFSPEDSLKLHRLILDISENALNSASERLRKTRLEEASMRVEYARSTLQKSLTSLQSARQRLGVLDTDSALSTYEALLIKLRTQVTEVEQEISLFLKSAPNSRQLNTLERKKRFLDEKIEEYESVIASSNNGGKTIAAASLQLSKWETQVLANRRELVTQMALFEEAKAKLSDQEVFLQTSVRPSLPETSMHPQRAKSWLISIAISFFVWGCLLGVGGLVRDYRS